MIHSIKIKSFLPFIVLTFLALAFAILMPDIAQAGEGLSKLVKNVATEGQDSIDPMLLIATFIGIVFVIVSLVMFANLRQGKSMMTPIVLFLFGGALLSATYVMSLGSATITQGETVNIDQLLNK